MSGVVITNILSLVRDKGLPHKAHEIDLRFFTKIRFADTWSGTGSPVDGVEYSAVLYGNKVVLESAVYRTGDMKHRQGFDTDDFYRHMFEVSQVYLRIITIARRKYPPSLEEGDCDNENWDCVHIPEPILVTLESHPQFQVLRGLFDGLELKKEGVRVYRVMVECSKQ